ncbi:MAG: hypothetical protein ACO3GO_06215 [Terrimicrobiaceae bacterium]
MEKIEILLNEDAGAKKRRLRMVVSILIGVVLLHVAAGVVAGIFIVAKYIFPPPANFMVKKDVRLPAKKREHKMNMASFDAIAPKPTLSDKMQSSRPTKFSLPDLPAMPLDQMLPLDPSQLLADQMASISNTDALGAKSGAAAAGSGGFGGKGLSFLGLDSNGQRVLLALDVSTSVENKAKKAGIPFDKIGVEIQSLLKSLPITSRFGMIQFSRLMVGFSEELVPASNPNRQAATQWINEKFGKVPTKAAKDDDRSGLLGVLNLAQNLKPDVIFIVSDGSFQSEQYPAGIPWKELKKAIEKIEDDRGKPARINFIAFEPKDEDLKELRKLANASKGSIREMK